jgi:hypothetical protein
VQGIQLDSDGYGKGQASRVLGMWKQQKWSLGRQLGQEQCRNSGSSGLSGVLRSRGVLGDLAFDWLLIH